MEEYVKICPNCQENFKTKNSNQICCSKGCSNCHRRRHVIRPKCKHCGKTVYRQPSHCSKTVFCSKICEAESRKNRIIKECVICQKKFETTPARKERKYCSQKCMGVDVKKRNALRSPQYRSFGECVLAVLLKKNGIKIQTSNRGILNGFEIDIWLPDYNTGIEYNGIHHFKPVYGEEIFRRTKNADQEKRKIAKEKNIKLIDVNVLKSISPTCKTAYINFFLSVCKELNLAPQTTDFTKEEVKKEQSKL